MRVPTGLELGKEGLPEGWVKIPIKHILKQRKDKFDPRNRKNQPFIGLEHIESHSRKIIGYGNSKDTKSMKNVFGRGDVLYGKLRPYLNKVASPNFDGVCSTDIWVFQRDENLDSKYVMLFLSTNRFVNFASRNMSGTQHPRIKWEKFSECLFWLPPLNEQHRIVSKIESIFSQIDAKQKQLEILVRKAKSSLENIRELKNSMLQQTFNNSSKKYQSMILDDVCVDIQPGFAQGEKNVRDGIIHLRMNNITTDFTMNFDLLRTITATEKQKKKYALQKNDVIFVNTNSVELIGKSSIFTYDRPCLYSNHLTRLRSDVLVLEPKWLLYFIQFKWMKRDFALLCNKWINQAAINTTKIKEIQIPLPLLNEQKHIVSKIESIFSRIDARVTSALLFCF